VRVYKAIDPLLMQIIRKMLHIQFTEELFINLQVGFIAYLTSNKIESIGLLARLSVEIGLTNKLCFIGMISQSFLSAALLSCVAHSLSLSVHLSFFTLTLVLIIKTRLTVVSSDLVYKLPTFNQH
jgi:hypothetical protein